MDSKGLILRDVQQTDLDVFFEHQLDREACYMAAFTAKDPTDRTAFDVHWAKIAADPTVVSRTVVVDGQVAGSVGKFQMFGLPQVTYWIGREFWGQGVATAALRELLKEQTTRPIYASAAADNLASIRVLEK